MTLSHACTTLVEVTAETAFAYLADPDMLGRWALGCWGAEVQIGDLFRGESLFSGEETWARIDADRDHLMVDYRIGSRPDDLQPRISARVVPGSVTGHGRHACLITLTAWRPARMKEPRWQQLITAHETEVLLIKGQLERKSR